MGRAVRRALHVKHSDKRTGSGCAKSGEFRLRFPCRGTLGAGSVEASGHEAFLVHRSNLPARRGIRERRSGVGVCDLVVASSAGADARPRAG